MTKQRLQQVILAALLLGTMHTVYGQSPTNFQDDEYYKSTGLDVINAAEAYALGYTGKGVILGVIDGGVLLTHPEFAGKSLSEIYTAGYIVDWNTNDHGSHVAGIMAANRNGIEMQGIAYEADLAAVAVVFTDATNTATAMASLEQRDDVKIINNSWGNSLCFYYIFTDGVPIAELRDFTQNDGMLHELYKLSAEYDKVNVISAGNSGNLGPTLPAALRNLYTNLTNTINVVALEPAAVGKGLGMYSNLAKAAEDYSIAAPGTNIYSLNSKGTGTGYMLDTGTSMAAPFVTGALGLVEQAYPWMSGRNLVDAALSTANRSFTPPSFHVSTERIILGPSRTQNLQINVLFLNHPATITDAEVQQALKDFYSVKVNADLLDKAFKIQTLEELKSLYAGTLSIDLLKARGNTKDEAILPGSAASTTFDELYGQGILDAGKAVKGISQLNANRMTTADIDTTHGLLYPLTFDTCTSVFSNDIDEQLWIDSHHYSDSSTPNLTAEYATMAKQTNVGLLKDGTGALYLTGTNVYKGDTVIRGGTLGISKRQDNTGGKLDGSNVYVEKAGTLTGDGNLTGNLTNSGTLVPGLTGAARNFLNTYAAGTEGTGSYADMETADTTGTAHGTLTVQGNLYSNGNIQVGISDTESSKLAVSGRSTLTGTKLSLLDGSTKPLANYNYTYLTSQGGITGNATAGEVLSPYLTLTSTISGNTGLLMAKETTPLGSLDGMSDSERSVGHALSGYQENAVRSAASSARAQTLNDLFYQNGETSRNVMKQLTSSDRAQLINVNPLSAMTTGAVYDRLDRALYDGNVNVAVPMNSFDGVPASMQVSTPVTLDLDHNFWFKLLRGFEYYGGTDGGYDLHNKSFGGVIGYDKAVNATTRLGGLFSYAKTDYSTDVMSGDSHDWRIGVYASHDNGTWKTQGMLSYGQNRYDFNRYIPYYGDKLSSDYDANIFDVDAKVTYLPQENRAKSWQVAPYGRLSYTHASQGAYTEEGSSVFAQDMDSASNSSFRAEAGVEWKHQMDKTSSWGGSVGYKRILSGANPELNGTFAGDTNGFTLSGDNDKNYVTYSVNLNKNTGNNWTVQGELRGEMSGHNHSEVYSLMAKHAF